MMRKHTRGPSHPQLPGQSMVEFALIAPLLIMIVIGIIELGILFSAYVGLTNSAREGARAAAIYRYNGPAPQTNATALVPTIDAGRQDMMSTAIAGTLNPITPVESVTLTSVYVPANPDPGNLIRAGDTISVSLEYNHRLLWGLFGERDIVLRAQSAARLEPGGAR